MKIVLLLIALTLGLFGCTFISKYIYDTGKKEATPSASPAGALTLTTAETGTTSDTGAPAREVSQQELIINFKDEVSTIPEIIKIPDGTYLVKNPKCMNSPIENASFQAFGNAEYKIAKRELNIAYNFPDCRILVSYLIKGSGILTSIPKGLLDLAAFKASGTLPSPGRGLLDLTPSGNIECSDPSACAKAASRFGAKCGTPSSLPSVIYGLRLKSKSPFSVELVTSPTDPFCSSLNKGSGSFSFELVPKE